MILQLVLAELRNRPARAAFLLAGYAFGVSVMVVLLAVGEAMLSQARDRTLLGGGDLILVPAGISAEMLRAGGTGSLFLGLDEARFIQRSVLESPRGRQEYGIVAASPLLDGRIVRISRGGRSVQAIAAGEIPSRSEAAGAAPRMLAGGWSDSDSDRRWVSPSPAQLYHEIDSFHRPYGEAVGDSTWAEWHYFNVVLDEDRWIYLTYLVGGRIGIPGEWGGQLLLTVRSAGGTHRSITRDVPDTAIELDTARADLTLGPENIVRQRDGTYLLNASVDGATIDLRLQPAPHRLFPPTEIGGAALVSGYVVPALAATAEGRVCLPLGEATTCESVQGAPAYHDHNWGVWRDVSWEWGAASDETTSLLYGAVDSPESPDQGIFAYLVDEAGVRGLYRPSSIVISGTETAAVGGVSLELPTSMRFEDARRGLLVEVEVLDRHVTDMEREVARYFVQMRGIATVTEAGLPPRRLEGFFETYVD
ncbi:MAG: hypothetical protein WD766_03945 [Gemmatimonadota bacterium]